MKIWVVIFRVVRRGSGRRVRGRGRRPADSVAVVDDRLHHGSRCVSVSVSVTRWRRRRPVRSRPPWCGLAPRGYLMHLYHGTSQLGLAYRLSNSCSNCVQGTGELMGALFIYIYIYNGLCLRSRPPSPSLVIDGR